MITMYFKTSLFSPHAWTLKWRQPASKHLCLGCHLHRDSQIRQWYPNSMRSLPFLSNILLIIGPLTGYFPFSSNLLSYTALCLKFWTPILCKGTLKRFTANRQTITALNPPPETPATPRGYCIKTTRRGTPPRHPGTRIQNAALNPLQCLP